jgi:hypothetical protein
MKSHVADWQTRVYCVRIEPANDSPIVRLAGYPVDLTMSNGQVYLTESGYEFSGLDSTSTFASASIDLNGILQKGAISRTDLASGVYDNARVYLFATSWANPIEDEEPLGLMFFGAAQFDELRDSYSVQLMGAIDVLSQSVGRTYTASCQWTLFDQHLGGALLPAHKSRCTGPRSAPDGPDIADYLVTGTITSVTDQYMFADAARIEAAGWFDFGEFRFTSGKNAGLAPIRVKAFTAGGVMLLHDAMFYLPEVGDAYEMIPGCNKTGDQCRDKYDNKLNNGGFEDVPSPTQYSQVGRGA